jgi:hypothetical protein
LNTFQEYMYSTVAFALALCDAHVFCDAADRTSSPPVQQEGEQEGEGVQGEVRGAGWVLVGAAVLYLGSWGLVLGIPGAVGVCGFAAIVLGAVLITGGRAECYHDDSSSRDINRDNTKITTIGKYIDDSWNVCLLRGYFTVVYFYAGVAKLESDWLHGWTLRELLRLWTGR